MNNPQRLPCSAFEELMLAQDCISYPSVIVCRFQFRGSIDRQTFTQAVRQLIQRHPMFRARLTRHWWRSSWAIYSDIEGQVEWSTKPASTRWMDDSYLDVRRESGLRIIVEIDGERVSILFQVHHGLVDGLALAAAIHDLLVIYDSLLSGTVPNLPRVLPEELPDRNRFGLNWKKLIEIAPKQCIGLAGVRQFLMRKAKPLVVHPVLCGKRECTLPVDVLFHRFDEKTTSLLQETAARLEVTTNDILAASIFAGCSESKWVKNTLTPKDWLRMVVPVSMRSSKKDMRQTACNIVSSIVLDRSTEQIVNRDVLLDSIHREMNLIKSNRLALMFIFSLWLWKSFPFRPRAVHERSKCLASVIFTNLGKLYARSPLNTDDGPLIAGNLVLDEIQGATPLVPHASVAITAFQYAGKMKLSLRYDSRIVAMEAAKELMMTIVVAAHQYIDNASSQRSLTPMSKPSTVRQ